MIDAWTERLSEYLDGELAPEEKTLCEAHVATCASCREALDGLRAVVMQARALPEVQPAHDLWPGVAARIAAFAQETASALSVHVARPANASSARGTAGRFSFTWPQLAAAGLALVALSAGGSWYAAGKWGGRPGNTFGNVASGESTNSGPGSGSGPRSGSDPIAAYDPDGTSPRTTASHAATGEADRRYAKTVADLQQALEERRDELEPRTVMTIEANLKIIDLATSQARQALADDPGNPYLEEHLSKTMQRKVELLREATMLASAH